MMCDACDSALVDRASPVTHEAYAFLWSGVDTTPPVGLQR